MNLIDLLNKAGYGAHPKDFLNPDVSTADVAAQSFTETTGMLLADLLETAFAEGMSPSDALDLLRCSAMVVDTSGEQSETTIIWVGAEWPKGARAVP